MTVEGAAWNWRGAISQKSADSLRELGIKDSVLEILSVRVVEKGFRMVSLSTSVQFMTLDKPIMLLK